MAYNHRKLILVDPNVTKLCDYFCNSDLKEPCSLLCFPQCPSICYNRTREQIPPPTINHRTSPPFLIITLSLLAATFALVCLYVLYLKFNSRLRRSRNLEPQADEIREEFLDEDHGPVDHHIWLITTVGLQPSVIDSITVCKYKRSDGLVEGTDCSVCLNEFREDETLRLLPKCSHAFHIPCIDTWLRSHTNCPMCRAPIVANPAGAPSRPPEPISGNLSSLEQIERELGREPESGSSDEEGNGKVSEVSRDDGIDESKLGVIGQQPIRRSVSFDSISASMISIAVSNGLPREFEGNSSTQLLEVKKSNLGVVPKGVGGNIGLLSLVGSSSTGRSLQNRPVWMKRSLSCSGKLLFSRYGRSQRF